MTWPSAGGQDPSRKIFKDVFGAPGGEGRNPDFKRLFQPVCAGDVVLVVLGVFFLVGLWPRGRNARPTTMVFPSRLRHRRDTKTKRG